MNWQSEVWSCYYCGSYNENHLYYCPHCNARRVEGGRLNSPYPTEHEHPDTPYFMRGGVVARAPKIYMGSIKIGGHEIEIKPSDIISPNSWYLV